VRALVSARKSCPTLCADPCSYSAVKARLASGHSLVRPLCCFCFTVSHSVMQVRRKADLAALQYAM
jgi:hypothetical protein